jgi:hypothetical protein
MLSHFRKRAEECALRLNTTQSESLRRDYQQLLESWMALIRSEEERLSRPVYRHRRTG